MYWNLAYSKSFRLSTQGKNSVKNQKLPETRRSRNIDLFSSKLYDHLMMWMLKIIVSFLCGISKTPRVRFQLDRNLWLPESICGPQTSAVKIAMKKHWTKMVSSTKISSMWRCSESSCLIISKKTAAGSEKSSRKVCNCAVKDGRNDKHFVAEIIFDTNSLYVARRAVSFS